MKIDRCVCDSISFEEVLEIAKEYKEDTLEGFQSKTGMCDKCGMCEPFLKESFKTKQTVFNFPILTEE